MRYTHTTNGKTCTSSIAIELDETNHVKELIFSGGGCQGNLIALRDLLLGKDAKFIIEQFKGIQCGNRGTSCADQLALCVEKALELQNSSNSEKCYFYTKTEDTSYVHECTLLNDICEHNCNNCVYATDKEKYEKIVNKIENPINNSSIL